MGRNRRGERDGTGPYQGSWQRRNRGNVGKRRESGEECPWDYKAGKWKNKRR